MQLDYYPYPSAEHARKVARYVTDDTFRSSKVIRIRAAVGNVRTRWNFIRAGLTDEEMKDYDAIAENLRLLCAMGAFEKEEIYGEVTDEAPPV